MEVGSYLVLFKRVFKVFLDYLMYNRDVILFFDILIKFEIYMIVKFMYVYEIVC